MSLGISKINHSQDQYQTTENQKNNQGGFVAVLHRVMEETWGPNSPFDEKSRLFFFVQHKMLRNKQLTVRLSLDLVSKSTGIPTKNIYKLQKILAKAEMLIASKTEYGMVEYKLHPKRFGDDYVYKKSSNVIEGKFNGSQPKVTAHSRRLRLTAEKEDLSTSKLLTNSSLKNPSYENPLKKNPSYEIGEIFENLDSLKVIEEGESKLSSWDRKRGINEGEGILGPFASVDQIIAFNLAKLKRHKMEMGIG